MRQQHLGGSVASSNPCRRMGMLQLDLGGSAAYSKQAQVDVSTAPDPFSILVTEKTRRFDGFIMEGCRNQRLMSEGGLV